MPCHRHLRGRVPREGRPERLASVPGISRPHRPRIVGISRGDHAAGTLAGFLRALHVEAPAEAPTSSDRGAHPQEVHGRLRLLLSSRCTRRRCGRRPGCLGRCRRGPEWEGPPVWVHGDLHPADVVVADGTLSGVIDFGDMFAGDPAWDLAAAWVVLPAGDASRFFDVYAHADEATIRRARGLAALKSLFLMLMGQNGDRGLPGGKPTWGPAGRAALDRVLSER
ncbi:phosphotransferase [Streptomyces sp. NPDC020792]|uniref:phosphotransferase n=1 Tax=Streptomyces sp. NPDC020792 TaxID=3365089 RepID=UPI00378EC9CE